MYFSINDIFSFSSESDDFNVLKKFGKEYNLDKVETVNVFSEENRVLILTRDSSKTDFLYCFDLKGNLVFKITPPEHYSFWYLSGKQIACKEEDSFAIKSPLSGWWFSIDLNTGGLIMGSPAF